MKNREVLLGAINTYGIHSQITMVFEEMAELQKELCKWYRGTGDNYSQIAEEMADVEIMLEQVKIMFNLHAEVSSWRRKKIIRLQQRLEEEDSHE